MARLELLPPPQPPPSQGGQPGRGGAGHRHVPQILFHSVAFFQVHPALAFFRHSSKPSSATQSRFPSHRLSPYPI
uniref:Uncharacterized protein n=1 Tax=Zea mays TaxID=4577 RepID=A0A804QBC3_MAIZE